MGFCPSITANCGNRNGSGAGYKVLPLYIPTKQNQHTSAGRTIGWTNLVAGKYRATVKIHRKRCFSIVYYSTQESESSIWTSPIRLTKFYKKVFRIRYHFWFLPITISIVFFKLLKKLQGQLRHIQVIQHLTLHGNLTAVSTPYS